MVLGVSHFVGMALQNTMPWKTLAILLKDLSPTLSEAREVINILLKELETVQLSLQRKQKELENYQEENVTSSEDNNVSDYQESNNCLQNEQVVDDDVGQYNSLLEIQTSEDEIEVLEVVKEKLNDEMRFDLNESKQIDNELYTFIRNDKTSTSENRTTEENVQISIQRKTVGI